MAAAAACYAILHGSVRYISSDIHPFEVTFFRNLFGFLVLLPWFVMHGLQPLRTRRFGLHLLRAGSNVVAMLMFFMALSMTPLALVQALGFTAPLFTTVLAIFILGERVRLRRWTALIAGFVGALAIIRPGLQPVDTGSLLTLGSAAVWGFTLVIIKVLSRTDSAVTITAYMVLLMSPLSLIPALFFWTWPDPAGWFWLVVCGVSGTAAQLLMAQSFRVAEATVVLPFDFTKIVWGALIGYVVFGEVVDIWTWIGAAVIFAGVTYITYRERKLAASP
ncbi:MAG: EamA family transporter, partial [Gammaproteobacteria bacterium]|nr:EamA family transporter [Gammaproteobacteria bacterium]NIM71668.1 EamA family transporter [Gammaproteobacteria bacterium]NIO23412.1 EamA family transporter [Gammaproteobacteria bacterium]NIO64033.1 EamA family transporter [Gammaproteobacteria bacterium]NIP63042.1 EamA family transporter [Gammaproteobacteria bacterium]